jgi:hypothetical protein
MFPLVLIVALMLGVAFYCPFAMVGTGTAQTQPAAGTRQLLCGQYGIYNDNPPLAMRRQNLNPVASEIAAEFVL